MGRRVRKRARESEEASVPVVVALLHAHLHLVRGALGGGLEVLGLQLLLQELVVRALWGQRTDGAQLTMFGRALRKSQ